jgi:hypothetical protein
MADVDLPPVKALALRARVAMMVVVPTFAEGHESKDEAVLRIIASLKTLRAYQVGEGINEESAVI